MMYFRSTSTALYGNCLLYSCMHLGMADISENVSYYGPVHTSDPGYNGTKPQVRKRKRFPHGNYTGYYGTRYGKPLSKDSLDAHDPRIDLLPSSWFEGKKCLDVGCNEGYLTLALVRQFRPRRMVGIDIDGLLVQRARQVLVDEIRAGADVAKREAEGHQKPSGTQDNDVESGSYSKVISATKISRPLMPRSLRGPPHPRTTGKPAHISPKGESDSHAGSKIDDQVALSNEQKQAKAPTPLSPESQQPGIAENTAARAPRKGKEKRKTSSKAKESELSLTEVEQPSVNAPAKNRREAKSEVKPPGKITPLRRMESGDQARPGAERQNGYYEGTVNDAAPTFLAGCSVSFEREDFVTDPHGDRGYDVVSLFSVIKWMHINGGDHAVRCVFRKAHALLRPGGRLILEPQPWKSYKKSARQHGSAKAQEHANTIRLRPPDFPALLTGEVGFRMWEEIGPPEGAVGGFANRSVHVFVK